MRIINSVKPLFILYFMLFIIITFMQSPAFATPEDTFYSIKKKAEQGSAEAQQVLGFYYELGDGFSDKDKEDHKDKYYFVPQDYVEAQKWYHKSAKQGNANAQQSLAVLYYGGRGVRKDYKIAFAWASLASVQGDENGTRARDLINDRLDKNSLIEAKKLANAYYKKYVIPFR